MYSDFRGYTSAIQLYSDWRVLRLFEKVYYCTSLTSAILECTSTIQLKDSQEMKSPNRKLHE